MSLICSHWNRRWGEHKVHYAADGVCVCACAWVCMCVCVCVRNCHYLLHGWLLTTFVWPFQNVYWILWLFACWFWSVWSFVYRPETYHLLDHNCNTFSNEVAQFLTGKGIPSHITNLPQEILNTQVLNVTCVSMMMT